MFLMESSVAEFWLYAIANGIDRGEVVSVHVKEEDSVDNYDLVLLFEIERPCSKFASSRRGESQRCT